MELSTLNPSHFVILQVNQKVTPRINENSMFCPNVDWANRFISCIHLREREDTRGIYLFLNYRFQSKRNRTEQVIPGKGLCATDVVTWQKESHGRKKA